MAKKSALDNLTQLEWLEFVNKTDMDKVRTCPQCGEDIEYSNYHNMLRAIRSHSLCKKCGSKNNFDKINNDQKNNTKICKKCGEEYIGHKKSLYCKKCRSKTFYERNIKFRLKYPDKQKKYQKKNNERRNVWLREEANEYNISTRDFNTYGKRFLLEHEDILEVLQIKNKIKKEIDK